MNVGPEETKTLKIKNQDLTTMTTKMPQKSLMV